LNYIAFDPGKDGGIAWNAATCGAIAMPISGKEIDIYEISQLIKSQCWPDNSIAIIEQVHSMPGQGVKSVFTFGKGYGSLIGLLVGLGIRTELVTPQAWKKVVLAGTVKDKDAAIAYCRRAFPQISLLATPRCKTPHDGIADALCILEYGRRTYG
jgi:crossover junction endodeoxyribonuclease RuvC